MSLLQKDSEQEKEKCPKQSKWNKSDLNQNKSQNDSFQLINSLLKIEIIVLRNFLLIPIVISGFYK